MPVTASTTKTMTSASRTAVSACESVARAIASPAADSSSMPGVSMTLNVRPRQSASA